MNDIEYAQRYRHRRFFNWVPLALTYSCMYMGRFNFNLVKNDIGNLYHLDKAEMGLIAACGFWTYAFSVAINGSIIDRLGGRRGIIVGSLGSAILNALIGYFFLTTAVTKILVPLSILWSINMYFQSWGGLSIVKINSAWFPLKERGVFGGVFGAVLSTSFILTNTIGAWIISHLSWIFIWFIPSALMFLFAIIDYYVVRNKPSECGLNDIDTGDGSIKGDIKLNKITFSHFREKLWGKPVILMLVMAEFCTGFIRQGLLLYSTEYLNEVQSIEKTDALFAWSGVALFIGAALGGLLSGWISDKYFQSRRAPSAFIFFIAQIIIFSILGFSPFASTFLGQIISIIGLGLSTMLALGIHGLLSGTAGADFGGTRGAATVVGFVDSFQYFGSGFSGLMLGWILNQYGWGPQFTLNGWYWMGALLPCSLFGALAMLKIWGANPQSSNQSTPR
ncbi:MAG: MFS transporter [Holophagaceae bacterium]